MEGIIIRPTNLSSGEYSVQLRKSGSVRGELRLSYRTQMPVHPRPEADNS